MLETELRDAESNPEEQTSQERVVLHPRYIVRLLVFEATRTNAALFAERCGISPAQVTDLLEQFVEPVHFANRRDWSALEELMLHLEMECRTTHFLQQSPAIVDLDTASTALSRLVRACGNCFAFVQAAFLKSWNRHLSQ